MTLGRDIDYPGAVAARLTEKYGQATTHWIKLLHRVERGVGNPCPLLLIGLPASIVRHDSAPVEELGEDAAAQDAEAY